MSLVDSYSSALKLYVKTNKDIIEALEFIRQHLESAQSDLNLKDVVCKGIGATSAGLTVGAIFIPFLGIPAAILAIVDLTGEIYLNQAGNQITQTFQEAIHKKQRQHEAAAKKFAEESQVIQKIAKEVEKLGYDEDSAMIYTVSCLFLKIVQFGSKGMEFANAAKRIHEAVTSAQIDKISKSAGIIMNGEGKWVIKIADKFGVGKATRIFGQGIKAFKVLAVAGVIISVTDIAGLIKRWNEPHPLVESIKNFVGQLQESCDQCQNFENFIQQIQAT